MLLFTNFGVKEKKRFIQEANRRSAIKGTIGTFGKWCRSKGLAKDGKVTLRCINKAKKSGNTKLIRRATFAKNIGGYAGAVKKRKVRFGKKSNKKPNKYTPAAGRKSPGVSATKFPVGTVKKGHDNNNWVVVKTSAGVKRWKKINTSFGKRTRTVIRRTRRRRRTYYHFGNRMNSYNYDKYNNEDNYDNYDNHDSKYNHYIQLDKDLDRADEILSKIPDNDKDKIKAETLIQKIKQKIKQIFTKKNTIIFAKNTILILSWLTQLLQLLFALSQSYNSLFAASGVFRSISRPLTSVLNHLSKDETKIKKDMDNNFVNLGWKKFTDENKNDFFVDPRTGFYYEWDPTKGTYTNKGPIFTGGYGGGGHGGFY